MKGVKGHSIVVFFFMLLVLIAGCTKEVDMDIPAVKSEPLVFALVANNQPFRLLFDKSYGIMDWVDSNEMHSSAAVVKLYVNNSFVEKLSYGNGFFHSFNYLPKPDDTLSVTVLPGGKDQTPLFAMTTIPRSVIIDTAWYQDSVFSDQDGTEYSRIYLHFRDIPDQKNYYEIYMRARCYADTSVVYEKVTGYASNSPIVVNEGMIGSLQQLWTDGGYVYEPSTVVFSDTLFQNTETELGISFIRPCSYVYGQPSTCKFDVTVYLSSVSKEYYLYRKTMYQHMISKESNIWTGYVEPIQLYSNINGGYGVFAAYSPVSVNFRIR